MVARDLDRLWHLARRRPLPAVLVTAGLLAYGWWDTGLHPFSSAAYAGVALPVAAVVAGYALAGGLSWQPEAAAYYRRAADGATWKGSLPWLALILATVGLESAGLALGGRSHTVPTLSDVVDHALAWHGVRLLFFVVWLALGSLPIVRLRASRARRSAAEENVV